MKQLITIALIALFAISLTTYYGCDEFETLPINIPISVAFTISGGNTSSNPTSFCLSESSVYQEYKEKIKSGSMTLVEISLRTTSVDPASIQGDVTIVIRRSDNTVIYTTTLTNIKPADYLSPNSPYVVTITGDQAAAFDSYLNSQGDCFSAVISVSNIQGGTSVTTLSGVVDVLISAEAEL